eukprot:NODE_32_length_37098_cov_1.132760.p25 type:complete len:158 gc:universal NODE_32_length_37098_cov_1.132760:26361-26834(+)
MIALEVGIKQTRHIISKHFDKINDNSKLRKLAYLKKFVYSDINAVYSLHESPSHKSFSHFIKFNIFSLMFSIFLAEIIRLTRATQIPRAYTKMSNFKYTEPFRRNSIKSNIESSLKGKMNITGSLEIRYLSKIRSLLLADSIIEASNLNFVQNSVCS